MGILQIEFEFRVLCVCVRALCERSTPNFIAFVAIAVIVVVACSLLCRENNIKIRIRTNKNQNFKLVGRELFAVVVIIVGAWWCAPRE